MADPVDIQVDIPIDDSVADSVDDDGVVTVGGAAEVSAPVVGRPWPARLRETTARHPYLADALLTFLLATLVGTSVRLPGDLTAARILTGLLCVPLVVRRRYPLAVFGFLSAVALTQLLFGFAVVADGALLIALYTVAAHRDRRWALLATAVLEVGSCLAVVRWWWGVLTVPALVLLTGATAAATVLGIGMRFQRDYLASLKDRAVRAERERDQQSLIVAAAERARIAREMHDVVAHNLSVMIALADGAAFAVRTGSPEAEKAARQVSATGRGALAEMQRLLGVLRDPAPDASRSPQPGVGQLDDLVGQVRAAGLATTFTTDGLPFDLPTTAGLAVYRVVQEALTNVLKHADSPTSAHVVLRYRRPVLDVEVSDDGRSVAAPEADGHGLAGMRERAAVFGGHVDAGPGPSGGWRVAVRLDVGADEPVAEAR